MIEINENPRITKTFGDKLYIYHRQNNEFLRTHLND